MRNLNGLGPTFSCFGIALAFGVGLFASGCPASSEGEGEGDGGGEGEGEGEGEAPLLREGYFGLLWSDDARRGDYGVAQFDADCAATAADAGFSGTWIAWLSTSTTDAIDRIGGDGPWIGVGMERASGNLDVAFDNKAALAGESQSAISAFANGNLIGVASEVWTGTITGGTAAADTCSDWTAQTGRGSLGQPGVPADWTDVDATLNCSLPSHFLCIQSSEN